ncbi:unnamed protein product [Anisakis simplex]|uniref:Uncharacterized protein n=1 Tax=Anisakis simplex TaxID=6269 RepID=A0A0M3IZ15_ANISI|nr:unnamed protein product [Anisakis simplex]
MHDFVSKQIARKQLIDFLRENFMVSAGNQHRIFFLEIPKFPGFVLMTAIATSIFFFLCISTLSDTTFGAFQINRYSLPFSAPTVAKTAAVQAPIAGKSPLFVSNHDDAPGRREFVVLFDDKGHRRNDSLAGRSFRTYVKPKLRDWLKIGWHWH